MKKDDRKDGPVCRSRNFVFDEADLERFSDGIARLLPSCLYITRHSGAGVQPGASECIRLYPDLKSVPWPPSVNIAPQPPDWPVPRVDAAASLLMNNGEVYPAVSKPPYTPRATIDRTWGDYSKESMRHVVGEGRSLPDNVPMFVLWTIYRADDPSARVFVNTLFRLLRSGATDAPIRSVAWPSRVRIWPPDPRPIVGRHAYSWAREGGDRGLAWIIGRDGTGRGFVPEALSRPRTGQPWPTAPSPDEPPVRAPIRYRRQLLVLYLLEEDVDALTDALRDHFASLHIVSGLASRADEVPRPKRFDRLPTNGAGVAVLGAVGDWNEAMYAVPGKRGGGWRFQDPPPLRASLTLKPKVDVDGPFGGPGYGWDVPWEHICPNFVHVSTLANDDGQVARRRLRAALDRIGTRDIVCRDWPTWELIGSGNAQRQAWLGHHARRWLLAHPKRAVSFSWHEDTRFPINRIGVYVPKSMPHPPGHPIRRCPD